MTEPALVSTDWLASHLSAPDVKIVDASWYLPMAQRDAKAEYDSRHIPGAVFFDLDDICDSDTDLPHMLPSPEKFSSRVRKLGIGDGHHVVVYDAAGIFSSPRVWWMFRAMGHTRVSVLDGGLPKWLAENRPTDDMASHNQARHFTPRANALLCCDRQAVEENLTSKRAQLVDARGKPRFDGSEPEPRAGLRAGHIPDACNVPFGALLSEDGTLKPADQLQKVFASAGVDLSQPIITSCGSGVTAAILSLALAVIGHQENTLYDGSWAEWGACADLPIETT